LGARGRHFGADAQPHICACGGVRSSSSPCQGEDRGIEARQARQLSSGNAPATIDVGPACCQSPPGVDLAENPSDAAPGLRVHRQEVDDVGPVVPVLIAVAEQLRGDRVTVGLVADQDAAEVVAKDGIELPQKDPKFGVFIQLRQNPFPAFAAMRGTVERCLTPGRACLPREAGPKTRTRGYGCGEG
jgi:hypothetical protein